MLNIMQPLIGEQTICVVVTVSVVCGVFALSQALLTFAIAAFAFLLL